MSSQVSHCVSVTGAPPHHPRPSISLPELVFQMSEVPNQVQTRRGAGNRICIKERQENMDSISVFVRRSGPLLRLQRPALNQEAKVLLSTLQPCLPSVPSMMARRVILKVKG